jgi:hypothetical protein
MTTEQEEAVAIDNNTPHKNKCLSGRCILIGAIVLTVNLITLAVCVGGVISPYMHLISAFQDDKFWNHDGFTDEYCSYFSDGQVTYSWYYDTDLDSPYLYSKVTYWYDPLFFDTAPDGVFIYGWLNGTSQNFYSWNTTSDEFQEIYVVFDDDFNVVEVQPYAHKTQDIDFQGDDGYSDTTELLYREFYVTRPFVSESLSDFMFNMDGTNELVVIVYDNTQADNTYWYDYKSIDLQSRKQVCSWNSRVTRRATLVKKLFQETGFNLNAFLTVNYLMLLLIFRKKQPTKSRLPLLALNATVVFIISTVAIIINITMHAMYYSYGDDEDIDDDVLYEKLARLSKGSVVVDSIQQIMCAFCMLVYSLHIARYYYLKYLYAVISKKENIGPGDFVVHRRLTSHFAFTIYASVILVVILAVFIPVTVSQYKSEYDNGEKLIIDSFVYSIRTIVLIIIGICFLLDVALNLVEIIVRRGKAFWWFFSFSDPLYFRVEMLLFTVIHLIIHPAFGMQVNITYQRRHPFVKDPFAPMFTRTGILSEMLYQIYNNFYLNFLICGGAICIIQLFCFIREKRTKKEETQQEEVSELELLLDEKKGYEIMVKYSEKEWSVENVLCWKYLWSFKKEGKEKAETIRTIYETFIRRGANMEVNIPNKTRKILAESIGENGDKIADSLFAPFFDLYTQVLINISDTFSRVKFSDEYQQYLLKQELINKQYL